MCEERSDELKIRVYCISTYTPDTSICNVGAAKFFAVSNVTNAPSIATCFARRSSVWYFMMFLTVAGTALLGPKIVKELKGEEGEEDQNNLKGKSGEKGYQSDVKV